MSHRHTKRGDYNRMFDYSDKDGTGVWESKDGAVKNVKEDVP